MMIITLWCRKCVRRDERRNDESQYPKMFYVGCAKCGTSIQIGKSHPGTVTSAYVTDTRTGKIHLSVTVENS